MERKVRDSCGICGTGETPQAICAEEAHRPPRGKRASWSGNQPCVRKQPNKKIGVLFVDKNKQGIQYMQEGNFEEAAKAFSEAIDENPKEAINYVNFGNLLSAVDELDKAIQFYSKAIELDENMAAAYYGAGNTYFNQSKFEQAKNMFEQSIQKGIENGDPYFMLGMTFLEIEQPKLALPYLQRAVELDENDVEARFQFGLCLAGLSMIDEAISEFNKVIELDPNHADAYYNLGVAYAGFKEDYQAALKMFDHALDAQPDHVLASNGKKIVFESQN